MAGISKRQADAYDRILEAAGELAELIDLSAIEISEDDLEELTIFLARNAPRVKAILKSVAHKIQNLHSIPI
jgi:dsDNA-binding SOS-regulon protein